MASSKPLEQPARRLTKTVSMDLEMVAAVEDRARREGHGNFSRVVTTAVSAYLADERTEGEAA